MSTDMEVSLALFAVCGALFTAFPPLFWWRSHRQGRRWWKSTAGRWVMGLNVVIALLVDLTLFTYFHGPWPGLPAVRIVLYAAFAAGGAMQLRLMWHSAPRP